MNPLKRFSFLAVSIVLIANLSACSKVLSQRTDEQAWIEFDKEVKSLRNPASYVDTQSPGLSSLRESLAGMPVRLFLLKCGAGANSSTCFHSSLILQFDETFRKAQTQYSELKVTDYKREQKAFLEFRSYDSVVNEVNRFHQSILSGLELKARTHAKDLFSECEADAQKESAIENFTVLSQLVYEMPKGTYACLSDHWSPDQKVLLEETTDRLGLSIVTEEAKRWIKEQQISPIYDLEISSTIEKKTHEELEQFTREKETVLAGLDTKAPQENILKEWSLKLHEKYPYSPVEQWIVTYLTDHGAH